MGCFTRTLRPVALQFTGTAGLVAQGATSRTDGSQAQIFTVDRFPPGLPGASPIGAALRLLAGHSERAWATRQSPDWKAAGPSPTP